MRESRRITRKSASNLALAFVMLPSEKADAMSALYAFCREVDDIADEDTVAPERRLQDLRTWREDIRRACANRAPELPVNRELAPIVQKYGLPCDLFEALLDGVEMDLQKNRYATWEELELYCYRVASVVGMLSIRIFGQPGAACQEYAVNLGKALQLTNILRDVRTDSFRGRIYIPAVEMQRFNVPEGDILQGRWSEAYRRMAQSVADRAEAFYSNARRLLPEEARRDMIASELMAALYWKLLKRLRAVRFDVFGSGVVRLSKPHKAALVLRAWTGYKIFGTTPAYGPGA